MKHYRRTCLLVAASSLVTFTGVPLFAQDGSEEGYFRFFGEPPEGGGDEGDQPDFDFGIERMNDPGMFGEIQPAQPPGAGPATPGETGELESLTFNGAEIAQVLLHLQRLAGRPVHPDSLVLSTPTKITIINSTMMTKSAAMHLLVDALFANRIAVIDRGSHLAVVPYTQIQEGLVPVLGPDEPVLGRPDTGMVVEKVFQIKYGRASTLKDKVQALGPPNMKIEVEDASNQIIALYNIGTLQRIQEQINKLDIPGGNLQLETFYLKYADADVVAKLIVGVFGQEDEQQGRGQNRNQFFSQPQPRQTGEGLSTSSQLKVVTDKSQNSVTVRAERDIIEQVRMQIREAWDVQIPGTVALPLAIELQNSSAVSMAELLNTLFAQEAEIVETFESDFFFGGGGAANVARGAQPSRGGDQAEGPKISRLAGQVSFTADNAKNILFVTTRSVEHYPLLQEFIAKLDVPGNANAPVLYELKHADAEDLANRLNALLAEQGARVPVERTSQELTQRSNVSQIGQQGTGEEQQQAQQGEEIQFPWQTGSADPNARIISNLIGQVRIMPIARQNAVLVVAPPELREAMARLIDTLDAPGRQVLIQAIVAEVSVDDALSLGIRWGSGDLGGGASNDNRIVVGSTIEGTKNELINALFDTSTLGVNVDLNVALQALAQLTDVNVLFRPKVVTSDNEEANFFDGQDIPFINNSTTSDVGGVTQSFEYLAVGIQLNVRPHITVDGNIDLRVNLQLSSVVPGQTLFGGSILDRRETTTKVTIRDGQTVVISGIRRTSLSDIVRKVPFLGDLPLIGGLFRSKDKTESRSELVAFIRPIILDSPEKIRNVTEGDFDLLNRTRGNLEGADVEKNPAGLDHWGEDYFRKEENGNDPFNENNDGTLWMDRRAPGRDSARRAPGSARLEPSLDPLPWQRAPQE